MADGVAVYIGRPRLSTPLGRSSLARCGLLTLSLLVALLIVMYMCSPVVISAYGRAERVLTRASPACSHDESRRYLQQLVSILFSHVYMFTVYSETSV